MTSPRERFRHVFSGGWSTDFGPTAITSRGEDGAIHIPFLIDAENMVFERSGGQSYGGIRKAPGSAQVNSSALESGADIVGVYDCWFAGTSGSPSQHRIMHIGTKIKKDDADGTFTDLFTGLTSGAVPSYAMLEDLLVMASLSSDVPRSWDGSTAQNLAGSPPNFGFVIEHANRLWASGNFLDPSAVYYSPYLDPENTSGEGWGVIRVDPGDKDIVTGLASHRGELIVFKGPYEGSIHRIQGTAPTGADGFRRPPPIARGVGAAGHNLIFHYGNDIGFVTPTGQVQSLAAVERYGDFDAIALNRGLRKFQSRINYSRLNQGWAATNTEDDLVAILLPVDGSTTVNFLMMMDYYWQVPRFFQWPKHVGTAICAGVDASANNRRLFYAGGSDGILRKLDQQSRVVDETESINMFVTTPFLDYNEPFLTKTLGEGYIEFVPKNNGDIDMFVKQDSQNRQQFTVSQLSGDPLGTVPGTQFTLGTSTLAESSAVKRFFEFEGGGDFRQIQYQFENAVVGEDLEIHSFGVTIEPGGVSTENDF